MADDDEKERLREAKKVTKQQAFYMKRAIDNDNLREALKHSSNAKSLMSGCSTFENEDPPNLYTILR